MNNFEPTTTPIGSEERVAIYCARYDALEKEGYQPGKDNCSGCPSLFAPGDDNTKPAVIPPGKRPGYPIHQAQKSREAPRVFTVSTDVPEHPFYNDAYFNE